MADGMLRCAQYAANIEALGAESTLRPVCGPHYSGVESPFAELLQVSKWSTDVRQRLASFGETGVPVREFLFGAALDQLDKLQAMGGQTDFPLLSATLGKFPDGDDTLVERRGSSTPNSSDQMRSLQLWIGSNGISPP